MLHDSETHILIARFYSGETEPEEAMRLEDWARLSEENRSYMNSVAAFFSIDVDRNRIDGEASAWQKLEDAVRKKNNAKGIIRLWVAGIAASIVLVTLISLLASHISWHKSGQLVYHSDVASVKISLDDRSEITMLPHSSIELNKSSGSKNRRIKLNGSANFSIVHDPSREFIVDVNHLYVRDIGTSFGIIASGTGDTISIIVSQGSVYVYDDLGSSATAIAGEKWIYVRLQKNLRLMAKQTKDSSLDESKHIAATPVKKMSAAKISAALVINHTHLQDTTRDSLGKYANNTHPNIDQPDVRGAPTVRTEKWIRDSTQSARIVTDLVTDGLIIRGKPLSFTLSDSAFILNDKKQSDSVFRRYLEKYGGRKAAAGWSWHHAENQPPKH
ncbi:MAG TPA: FecR family protein [Puia sp.]|nr:FecR family protein [Puia sp.]